MGGWGRGRGSRDAGRPEAPSRRPPSLSLYRAATQSSVWRRTHDPMRVKEPTTVDSRAASTMRATELTGASWSEVGSPWCRGVVTSDHA